MTPSSLVDSICSLPLGNESDCALFRCEAYDLVTDHSYNNDRRSLMLAAVQGHAVVFKVSWRASGIRALKVL